MALHGIVIEPEVSAALAAAPVREREDIIAAGYSDTYWTHFEWRADVAKVIARAQKKKPWHTFANTYYCHPPVYGRKYEFVSLDFWGGGRVNGKYVGYRGKPIGSALGWDMVDILWNDKYLPTWPGSSTAARCGAAATAGAPLQEARQTPTQGTSPTSTPPTSYRRFTNNGGHGSTARTRPRRAGQLEPRGHGVPAGRGGLPDRQGACPQTGRPAHRPQDRSGGRGPAIYTLPKARIFPRVTLTRLVQVAEGCVLQGLDISGG